MWSVWKEGAAADRVLNQRLFDMQANPLPLNHPFPVFTFVFNSIQDVFYVSSFAVP
jgi:hypothetical protein